VEHDLLLTRKDGSKKRFRIYGRPMPKVGETVTLPIDGRLTKARVRSPKMVGAADDAHTADIEAAEV
jgi:hypothetical protein